MKKTMQTIVRYAKGLLGLLVGIAIHLLVQVALVCGFFYLILGLQALLPRGGR